MEMRKAGGDAAEFGADGLHGKVKREDQQRPCKQRNDVGGYAPRIAPGEQDENESANCEQRGLRGDGGCSQGQHTHPANEVAGNGAGAEAEEVLDLGAGDKDRDAVGKAHDDRAGDELDGRAQAGDAKQNEYDAGYEGADQQAILAVALQDAKDDDDKGASGAADLAA